VLHRRMTATERDAVCGADLVWVCSDHDAQQIARVHSRRAGITVVPNGVDVDAYRRDEALPTAADWGRWPITMVYPGLFSYTPNEDAAMRLIKHVLPAVRARGCSARAVLVGRDPTPALLAAAQQDAGVEVTGWVESVLPYLKQACVVTLPIRLGSGTRLKILEAFAIGRPVISTAKGAEGIDAINDDHLLIREDVDAMAEAIIELWRRPLLRERLCERALELVRSRYSWSAAAQRIAQSLGLPSDNGRPPAMGVTIDAAQVRFTASAHDRVG
jgi:polysaccharide biosynthesis protein PslH